MDGSLRKVYEVMWQDFDFKSIGTEVVGNNEDEDVDKGDEIDSSGSSSFRFYDDEIISCKKTWNASDRKCQMLKKIFDISNPELFCDKYKQVTNGRELARITTIHSSALVALLFFYNVSKENPLTLCLKTKADDGDCRKVTFNESYFEYKSEVITTPSNIDVVLLGWDDKSRQRIALFLESKFSEYYSSASRYSSWISGAYLNDSFSKSLYSEESLKKLGLCRKERADGCFILLSSEKVYLEGIKQMISHYVGVRNVVNENYCVRGKMQKTVNEKLKDATIILGEILFDYGIGSLKIGGKPCFQAYQKKYSELAKLMSKQTENVPRLEILQEPLKYSQFKDNNHEIEDNIKRFYFSGNADYMDDEASLKDELQNNHSKIYTLYRKVKDLDQDESEELAEYLNNHIDVFDSISEVCLAHKIRGSEGYRLVPYREKNSKRTGKPVNPKTDVKYLNTGVHSRSEEYLAMELFNERMLGQLGYILDYQMPIGGTPEYLLGDEGGIKDPDSDEILYSPGKCDLVSYNSKTDTFYIIELKGEDSKECMLAAVLQAYTYLRLLDKKAVIENMKKIYPEINIKDDAKFVAAPLIFENSIQYYEYMDKENYPNLNKLITETLGEQVFILKPEGICQMN